MRCYVLCWAWTFSFCEKISKPPRICWIICSSTGLTTIPSTESWFSYFFSASVRYEVRIKVTILSIRPSASSYLIWTTVCMPSMIGILRSIRIMSIVRFYYFILLMKAMASFPLKASWISALNKVRIICFKAIILKVSSSTIKTIGFFFISH